MDGNHEKFLKHLSDSDEAVNAARDWFSKRGYDVQIPPHTEAKTHEEWKDHTDKGDLYIKQRVEVKRLSVEFSSRETWPFGRNFIVCAKHAFDRAEPKPYAFIIYSKNLKFAGFVMAGGKQNWRVEKRKDSRYEGVEQEFYLCDINDVRFLRMDGL